MCKFVLLLYRHLDQRYLMSRDHSNLNWAEGKIDKKTFQILGQMCFHQDEGSEFEKFSMRSDPTKADVKSS